MNSRQLRLKALAGAALAVTLLAACTTTRFSETNGGTGLTTVPTSTGQTGACVAGQTSIPGGPPYSASSTETADASSSSAANSDVFVPFAGTWVGTDDSQTCGCTVTLTETQPNVAGNVTTSGCQSSWMNQLAYYQVRNGGTSVAFSGGTSNTVLFELQKRGSNLMVGFAFGQRITIFRGNG